MDMDVLHACARWVAEGRRCELVTVIKTWGASPRPPGALLAVGDDGSVVGSVSGGCIEDDLIAKVRAEGLTRLAPELVSYGISADQAHRFGLPCGGTIELAIEPLSAASGIGELLAQLAAHQMVARSLNLATGEVSLAAAAPGAQISRDGDLLTLVHGPQWRLLIIGAGDMARFLAQVAAGMDYRVTVCDPREEYRANWDVDGIELIHTMPDDAVLEMRPDARTAIVALTHDPKLDDMALMEALKSDAFYVGAIGSHINNARRRERLREFDLSDAQLARLHGPIGLAIGSKTPAEIAIATLAHMIEVKNKP
jgi:xanthine dehydrogenase accessory factor